MKPARIRIGSRKSDLALAQAKLVQSALTAIVPESAIEIVPMVTTGDTKQGLGEDVARDKKDWIQQLEQAILADEIECAVHSAKDVPIDIASGTALLPVLHREFFKDCFIAASKQRQKLLELPQGAKIGTSSARRRAQLLALRPDFSIVALRGNVPTRIRKLTDNPDLDGIVIAEAGVRRLGISNLHVQSLPIDEFLPAVNQGILCVQYRATNSQIKKALAGLVEDEVLAVFQAERAFIGELGADCHSAVAVYGSVKGGELTLTGNIFAHDGSEALEGSVGGTPAEAITLGRALARKLFDKGGAALLATN